MPCPGAGGPSKAPLVLGVTMCPFGLPELMLQPQAHRHFCHGHPDVLSPDVPW